MHAPRLQISVRRILASFPSSRGDPATERPPHEYGNQKTFEGNRTASCCVYGRSADGGGTRAPMDEGRSRLAADRGALSGITLALSGDTPDFHRLGCIPLLRSPINFTVLTSNSALAALARSGRKSTARFRPLLHPGATRLLLFRSSSMARGPGRAREPPRFVGSCRPLADCQPIPNGEI